MFILAFYIHHNILTFSKYFDLFLVFFSINTNKIYLLGEKAWKFNTRFLIYCYNSNCKILKIHRHKFFDWFCTLKIRIVCYNVLNVLNKIKNKSLKSLYLFPNNKMTWKLNLTDSLYYINPVLKVVLQADILDSLETTLKMTENTRNLQYYMVTTKGNRWVMVWFLTNLLLSRTGVFPMHL